MVIEAAAFWVSVTLFGAGFAAGCAGKAFGWRRAGPLTAGAVAAAWALQTVLLVSRGLAQSSPPFITYFETVSFACWLAAGLHWAAARRLPAMTGTALCLIAFLMLGSAALSPSPLTPLPPGLQSWWLVLHVLLALSTFAALAVAAAAAAARLLDDSAMSGPDGQDRLLIRCVSFAFMAQVGMIASGSIWAQKAWGRYWGWDPIETFSLFTWVWYGIVLHLHRTYGWRGRRLAWMTVAGLVLCVYGIWGVPYFSQSVHLYEVG
ncbi:MAG: cytochrome c biogenesis protein CcsA [Elusimicrobia bacterium]|nr:cytochrome c biogenesis protein CcsA [Elusimicrobiota bacterium]